MNKVKILKLYFFGITLNNIIGVISMFKKISSFFVISICLVICFLLFIMINSFFVTNNDNDTGKIIQDFIKTNSKIEIKEIKTFDNVKIVLFSFENDLGQAELTKKWGNFYKIMRANYGGNFIKFSKCKTTDGTYLIVYGQNYNDKIDYITIPFHGVEYKINVPQNKCFLNYYPVEFKDQETLPLFSEIKFYNNENKDVSEEVFANIPLGTN